MILHIRTSAIVTRVVQTDNFISIQSQCFGIRFHPTYLRSGTSQATVPKAERAAKHGRFYLEECTCIIRYSCSVHVFRISLEINTVSLYRYACYVTFSIAADRSGPCLVFPNIKRRKVDRYGVQRRDDRARACTCLGRGRACSNNCFFFFF